MAGISANTLVPLMLIVVCTAMLVPAGQAQIPGLLSPMPELQKCWAALAGTQGCLIEIYTYFMSGQIGKIGSVCCATIAQVSKECWPKMFPINPLFPPLLKTACAAPSTNSPVANAAMSKVSFPGTAKVTDIEGCVSETYKSLLNIGIICRIGRDCCKAVTEINNKCMYKIFPFNPSFPPVLKSTFSAVFNAAPSPTSG